MTHIDLFSGIGGFALAAEAVWPGIEHIFCDNDPFSQAILKKHWPTSKIYGDIRWLADAVEAWYNQDELCQYHAHIVRTNQERLTLIGARSASLKPKEDVITGPKKDTRDTSDTSESLRQDFVKKLLERMEGSANVVEKQNLASSPLTTSKEGERENVKNCKVCNFIEVCVQKDFQKVLESSAITAITEHLDLVYAHTRNIDILTGGFPCQSFSQAGKRLGTADARWLWPEMYRIIRATSPRVVLAENVRGFLNWGGGVAFEQVCSDLENASYETVPLVIPACALGAPHRRDRVWIVGHSKHDGQHGSQDGEGGHQGSNRDTPREDAYVEPKGPALAWNNAQDSLGQRSGGGMEDSGQVLGGESSEVKDAGPGWESDWPEVATRLCGVFNGLSRELDEARLKYAKTFNKITRQDLPHLWHGFQSQAFQWNFGRFDTIQEQDYLFTVLWKLCFESNKQDSLPFESAEVQGAYMRNVWDGQEPGCPPCRWEYQEQYFREHQDVLSSLSHEVALATKEIKETYLKDRNKRLKGLGNAIVPQVAEQIMRAIFEVEQKKQPM